MLTYRLKWLFALLLMGAVIGVFTPAQPAQAAKTFRIIIPSIGLDVPIVTAPRTRYSWRVSHLGTKYAGFLQGSSYPGAGGNVVIAAHVEISATKPGPFFNLNAVPSGSDVFIVYGDLQYRYVVSGPVTVDPTDVQYALPTSVEVLTLITCASDNSQSPTGRYAKRLIVRAFPMGDDPVPYVPAPAVTATPAG
jgi:LPXTG-site transpeptidase (sortase) family protein